MVKTNRLEKELDCLTIQVKQSLLLKSRSKISETKMKVSESFQLAVSGFTIHGKKVQFLRKSKLLQGFPVLDLGKKA